MKSLDKVESLTSHLQLNFHPSWLAFLVQEIITKLLMHLPIQKKKIKNQTADFSVNIQTGHVGNWPRAPDAHRAQKRGDAQTWDHGNSSKGSEARKQIWERDDRRALYYNEKDYTKVPRKRSLKVFLGSLSAKRFFLFYLWLGFGLSFACVFFLGSWPFLHVDFLEKD